MYSRHFRTLCKNIPLWPGKSKTLRNAATSINPNQDFHSFPVLFRPIDKEQETHQITVGKNYSTTLALEDELVDSATFEKVCEETLNSLADYFEELVETESQFENADVMYGAGVLTVDLGKHGTYVINRQSPNRQIWLSSPTSGPKRFDFSTKENCWIYKHDGQHLHEILKKELENILGKGVTILNCSYSSLGKNS
ncbi:frataxin homolog, mitochondrial [Anthonomus grandis grandis]|uniref:frataxin homolog, mitochondrial n=1 Tax=Anthonomus grandis grandis TaxID=2921223 RepID=UPI0021652FEB|nr:frataxin homolog, mitochondrial [Anthonomus grandis grandis]